MITVHVLFYGLVILLPDPDASGNRELRPRQVLLVDAFEQSGCHQHFPFLAAVVNGCQTCTEGGNGTISCRSSDNGCIHSNLCPDSTLTPTTCDPLKLVQAPLNGTTLSLWVSEGRNTIKAVEFMSFSDENVSLEEMWPLAKDLRRLRHDQSEIRATLRIGAATASTAPRNPKSGLKVCSVADKKDPSDDKFYSHQFLLSYGPYTKAQPRMQAMAESALWTQQLNTDYLYIKMDNGQESSKIFRLEPMVCKDNNDEKCVYLFLANPTNTYPKGHDCLEGAENEASHFKQYFPAFNLSAPQTPKIYTRIEENEPRFDCEELSKILIPRPPDIDNRCLHSQNIEPQRCAVGPVSVTNRAACPIVQ